MDGISRALGVGPTITLCGETFLVKGHILRHYALMEAEVIKDRPDPMMMMREGAASLKGDPESLAVFVKECFEQAKHYRIVTGKELSEWCSTMRGSLFQVWLAIRDNDPERLTFDKVSQLFLDETENDIVKKADKIKELEAALDQASGEDELGNSTGRRQRAATAQPIGTGSFGN